MCPALAATTGMGNENKQSNNDAPLSTSALLSAGPLPISPLEIKTRTKHTRTSLQYYGLDSASARSRPLIQVVDKTMTYRIGLTIVHGNDRDLAL